MRLLEILLLLTLFTSVLSFFIPASKRPRWISWLPTVALGLAIIHLFVESPRWQMVPAYALVMLLSAFSIGGLKRTFGSQQPPTDGPRALILIGTIVGLLIVAVAAALPLLFPVFSLPQPTGAYAIGTTRFHFIDTSRPEIFSDDPEDRRELMVQVWYPAKREDSEAAPYSEHAAIFSPLFANFVGLPSFIFNHLDLVKTHSYKNAEIANTEETYPVLIFSHGYGLGTFTQNTVLMEELASHGYIVFSINHTYEALASIFPDGRVIPFDRERVSAVFGEELGDLYKEFVGSREPALKDSLFRKMLSQSTIRDESVRIWSADTRFVIDELEKINSSSNGGLFAGKMDLAKLGIFGMSFGGATAGQTCLEDSRCKAGINMDGWQVGDLIDNNLEQPFMFMYSEELKGRNDPVYARLQNLVYKVTINGTSHYNYSDFSIQSPVFKRAGFLGPIDGRRMLKIMNAYVLAFFNQHLKDKKEPLLNQLRSSFPEVEFEARNIMLPL